MRQLELSVQSLMARDLGKRLGERKSSVTVGNGEHQRFMSEIPVTVEALPCL